MASKYAKQLQVPEGFPEILRDFTREVLREQPADIDEFAFQYFKAAIKERDEGNPGATTTTTTTTITNQEGNDAAATTTTAASK